MALKGKLNLVNLSADPTTNLASGQVYYNTTDNVVKYYDGSAWVEMSNNSGAGSIPTSGLIMHLDAGNSASYPGTGSTWFDLTNNNYDWNVNASSFVSNGAASYFNFTNGYAAVRVIGGLLSDMPTYSNATVVTINRAINSTSDFRTFARGSGNDHQFLFVNKNTNDLGVYDNDNNGAFINSGYDITQIPNFNTNFRIWAIRVSTSNPYWRLSFNNDTSDTATITNSSAAQGAGGGAAATFNNGWCIIGRHHLSSTSTFQSLSNNPQPWGDVATFLYYDRHISYAEQANIYNYYKNTFGI